MYQTEQTAILLAAYNGQPYIREQIDSLYAQTVQDWVIYVHDDGSGDGTAELLQEYAQRDPAHFVIVDGAPQGGAKQNFFYLLSRVEAPYYMFCDQDDVWLPQKVAVTRNEMQRLEESAPAPCLVFTELQVADSALNEVAPTLSGYQGLDCSHTSLGNLLVQNVVTGCTVMINRNLRDLMLQYRSLDAIIMHDWWAALIAAAYGRIAFVGKATIRYRQHEKNNVGAKNFYNLKKLAQTAGNIRQMKESLERTRKQAAEFAEVFEPHEESLAGTYARARSLPRLHRWKFYRENGIQKSNLLRNIGFWLMG